MFTQVWPAFLPNLMSVAGEWAGWTVEFKNEFLNSTDLDTTSPGKLIHLKDIFAVSGPLSNNKSIRMRNETANHNQ